MIVCSRPFGCVVSKSILSGALGVILSALALPAQLAAPGGPGGGNGGGGNGGGGGGGGETETAGNNLSFPVIWADTAMTLPGTMGVANLAVPWPELVGGYYAYPQQTDGNVWQADNIVDRTGVAVDKIDWGDSLESIDMKVGKPVRIELSLYKLLAAPMLAFSMEILANASSPDEVQGVLSPDPPPTTTALTEESDEATVYSTYGRLVVQKLSVPRENIAPDALSWNGTEWTDPNPNDSVSVGSAEPLTFTGELNVAGKVIYGLSAGGWKPTQTGDYRITFYFAAGGNVSLASATIAPLEAETIVPAATGGGAAKVVPGKNITYIDVRVTARGGGGGGSGGRGK